MFRDMADIAALLKANKAAEAKPKMDRMQAGLDAPPTAVPETKPAGPTQVTARWTALVKEMQAIVAEHPEKKAELVRVSAGIPELIRAGKLDLANKQMETVEQALKENPREKEYRARYRALEARLAAAIKDPARDGSRLRAMSAFIVEKANAGDFETALKALLKLEEALSSAPAASAAAAKPAAKEEETEQATEDESEDDEKEAAALKKDLKQKMVTAMAQVKTGAQLQFMALTGSTCTVIVGRRVSGSTQKLLREISGGGGQIVQGECIFENNAHTFVTAKASGGLAKKLAKALLAETGVRYNVQVRNQDRSVTLDSETDVDPDATAGSLVEKRKFLLERWQRIPLEVSANLKALKDAIEREMPDEDADELIELSEDYLDDFYSEMKDAIDDDINSGDPQYQSAIGAIQGFRTRITSEPLIQHLKTNALHANVEVESILLDALAEVEQALAR